MNMNSESSNFSLLPSFLFPVLPTLRQGGGDMETYLQRISEPTHVPDCKDDTAQIEMS